MCFWKSEKSKVLRAKRDIVVYKIGNKANKNAFVPYFIGSFKYLTGIKCQTSPEFGNNLIIEGYHGYINIVITSFAIPVSVAIQKNTKDKPVISLYPSIYEPLYLGKFIVPKGAIYCVNELNEIISNEMIYTGQYSSVWEALDTNLKELWKEKQVKYFNMKERPIKWQRVSDVMAVLLTEVLSVVQLENLQVVVILLEEKIVLTQYLKK